MKKIVLALLLLGQSWIVVASNELKTAGIVSITALGGYVLANKIAEYPLADKALLGTVTVGIFSGIGMAAGGIYGSARLFCVSSTLSVMATRILEKRSQKEADGRSQEKIHDLFLSSMMYYAGGLAVASGALLGREQAFLSTVNR